MIDQYCESVRRLSEVGVKVLCYNFMPIFDWVRTDLAMPLDDGSSTMAYDHRELANVDLSRGMGEGLPAWANDYDGKELARLLRIAVTRLGITSVRFTGGEPLVAKHLEDVVAATAALRPRPEITLTTNGIGLHRRAAKLKAAGHTPLLGVGEWVPHFTFMATNDIFAQTPCWLGKREAGEVSFSDPEWVEAAQRPDLPMRPGGRTGARFTIALPRGNPPAVELDPTDV